MYTMLQVRRKGYAITVYLCAQRESIHSVSSSSSSSSSLSVVKNKPLDHTGISNTNTTTDSNSSTNANSNTRANSNYSAIEGDVFLPPGASSVSGLRRLPCSNIFVNPNTRQEFVTQAEFLKSSVSVKDCPKDGFLEFALVGRSNVGKSSLINTLVRRKQLAKTSKTPGKTQVINHFIINKSWYLVDLPGYGFARAPTNVRVDWDNFTRDYFLKRESLVSVMLLIDGSVKPKKSDFGYIEWLAKAKIPFTLVFTKCDKRRSRNKHAVEENVYDFLRWLKEDMEKLPPWIMTSSINNQGTSELLIHLACLRKYWRK